MNIDKVCKDIKSLKIQGAISVAKASAEAFFYYSRKVSFTSTFDLLQKLKKAATKLEKTRPTEPALRNALNFYFHDLNTTTTTTMLNHIDLKHDKIMRHFAEAEKKIIEYGAKKIKSGSVIYTHCHSSTVTKILIHASKKKKFEVYNTETRPLYQGRKTAKELSDAKIKVTHFVDSAARHAIKKADMILLGTDAITTTKIYNKIGSETIAMLADHYDVPVYCCTDSWKFDKESIFGFDEEIEKRISKEVWDKTPKNVTIYNNAFDMVSPKYITGIISELGVYGPYVFIEEAKRELSFS